MLFPLNTGVSESDVTATYTDKDGTNAKAKAFKNVSVNPTLYTTGLQEESDSTNPVASTIFTEIRKAPRKDGTVQRKIVATTNKETTPSFKVKIFDSNFDDETVGTSPNNYATNLRATYHFSLDFPTDRVGIDIENYDYFIILNHDIVDTASGYGVDSVNAHFAKITRIISFDEFGDGVEFSPKYGGEIPKGTKFEIYKGAAKTDTDLVAVSYGLRGDTSATTDKYDKICNVNTPTFYFYNDRLQEKDQLDYNEKYTVTSNRIWESPLSTISTSVIDAHFIYDLGTSNKQIEFSTAKKANWDKLTEGMSLFNSSGTYIGNVESLGHNGAAIESRVYHARLDFARIAIQASTDANLKIGQTIQNIVFKTEKKYDSTIQNMGRDVLDAMLVDNILVDDEDDNNFNPIFWHTAFPLMKRSTTDEYASTGTVWDKSSNIKGQSTYIKFESASLKNDKIPTTLDTIVNSPKNKMSKMATVTTLDNSGTQHLKVKEDSKMVVRNGLFSDSMKLKKIEHTVSKGTTVSTGLRIYIENMNSEFDYRSILATDSIVKINDYYYTVNVINNAWSSATNSQYFTSKAYKQENSNVWVSGSTLQSFTDADLYVVHYSNSKLNVEFAADTTVRHDQSDRLTLDDRTVEVKNTKLYNSRLAITNRRGHDLRVNYGDRTHKYLTVLEPTKQYYQKTPISRMYYYNGSFTLNEEIFNGNVEDIESKNENGMMTYTISGRDEVANLLTNTVNKNLNFTDDIVYSTLNPHIDNITLSFNSASVINKDDSSSIVVNGEATFTKYTLFFNSSYELLGEFSSSSYSGGGGGETTISLKDKAYATAGNNTTIYYYNPLDDSSRFISGVKALATNVNETTRPTDFTNTSEKGLIFNEGLNFTYDSSADVGNNNGFTYSDLKLTSNNGSFETDGSYGYDILKPSRVNKRTSVSNGTNDDEDMPSSTYLLKIGKEKETSIEYTQKNIVSSEMFHVIDVNDVNDSKNIITVAPNFPIALGVQDNNTYDNRFLSPTNDTLNYHAGFYLLNSNLPSGGFVHKLKHKFQHYFAPEDTYKFIDLQSFENQTLIPYDTFVPTNIYTSANRKHKIKGYTTGIKVLPNGYRDVRATNNSDMIWYKRADGTKNVDTTVTLGNLQKLVSNDWRARPYSLYATGDLYPTSKLRFNNISFSDKPMSEYGLMFENKGTKGTQVNHDHTGKTNATIRDDNDYEISEILSSTKTTSQIKRWGIVRLVEATFDWHFNSVDAECVKDLDNIDTMNIAQYKKYDTNNSNAVSNYNLFTQEGTVSGSSNQGLYKLNDLKVLNSNLLFNRVYILKPNIKTDYFKFALLEADGSDVYDPPNILLPIISEVTESNITISGASVAARIDSAFHVEKITGAEDLTSQKTHTSKVISALAKPVIPLDYNGDGTKTGLDNHDTLNESPHGIGWPNRDIYENCIAIFRDMKSGRKNSETLLKQTSSPLQLFDTDINRYGSSFQTRVEAENDQPTINVMTTIASEYSGLSNNLAFIGTKTKFYPFLNREDASNTGNRVSQHRTLSSETTGSSDAGEIYSAQMFIKPQLHIPVGNTNLTVGTAKTFTMDSTSTHHWLNFVPNLTGYYIVSTKLEGSSTYLPTTAATTSDNTPIYIASKGTPKYIGKITSHTVNESGTYDVHSLKFDKEIDESEHGVYFRLMRLSDTVFEETPDYFELNVMHDTGLKYDNNVTENFRTGEDTVKDQFNEGLYSMYMLLDIDNSNTYLERRNLTNISSSLFTNDDETVIVSYITDGINSQTKNLTITRTSSSIKFEYDGVLNGDGCVSFGETIDVTIPKKLSIKPTKCYLGTTFSIGGIVENEIENIAKEAGLDLNYEQSLRDYTTNLVDSNVDGSAKITGNVITCVDKPIDVVDGDVLYTQEGYLVGKVSAVSATTITVDGIIFVPSAYDELIRRQRKTHVSNVKFEDTDSFSAINFLANKRGLDYKISNGKIVAKNIEDVHSLRRFSISYKSGHNLISVESNKSLFDKANKIIVVGDGVKAESEIPTKKRTKTIRHVDSSIKSLSEAKIKATQLLQIHNADIRKIKLKIQKEGLELLEAGDILTLDFPNHDIPINDYQVFEIENILDGVSTITVGTFNKTIAERLGELSSNQTRSSFTLFGKNSVQSVVGKSVFDSFTIQNGTIEYKITASSETSNLGFNNPLGFSTLLGFGSGSTTVLKTYKSEKDV